MKPEIVDAFGPESVGLAHQHVQEIILDSLAAGVFTVDLEFRLTSFNREAERITGISRERAIGRFWTEVIRASDAENDCALEHSLRTGESIVNKAVYLVDNQGRRVPVSITTAVLKHPDGRVLGAVESFRDLTLVEELKRRLTDKYTFEDIVGRSSAMQDLFGLLPILAESDTTALIEGPSGTGKELVARAIHNLSPRKDRRFIAVNCAALPDTLLESELFGYKKGAFTDARGAKPGRLAAAEGGTLFLDEIGDISPAMQTRLLRVLQEQTYEPLGSVEPVKADVRVVAATNRNLDQLVRDGKFRDVLSSQLTTPAPSPSSLINGLPPGLEQIMLTAMHKDPANRYASMADLRTDLTCISNGKSELPGVPMLHEPDQYRPRNERGRRAFELFNPKGSTAYPPTIGA